MSNVNLKDMLFPGPLLWLLNGFLVLMEAAWIYFGDYQYSFGIIWDILISAGIAGLVGALLYRRWPRVQLVLMSYSFYLLFLTQIRVFSYMMMSAGNPYFDGQFAAIDAYLGLDWMAYLAWVNDRELLSKTFEVVYFKLPIITMVALLSLLILNMRQRMYEFFFLFATAAILTIVAGTYLPALGTYSFYQPAAELLVNIPKNAGQPLAHVTAIHDGTMTMLAIDKMKGIIAFPSFHTAMAILLIWIMRGTMLFWPFLLINGIMLAATPIVGGHYFIDVIGGAAVMLFFIGATVLDARRNTARQLQPAQLTDSIAKA